MDEERILYLNEASLLETPYLHIYEIKLVNDYINISVYSDLSVLELRINGAIRCRQKNRERFSFSIPFDEKGETVIRVSCKAQPEIFQELVIGV